MKKISLSVLSLLCAGFALPAFAASDLMVAATMQRCTANAECVLVTNSCNDNCGFVPVNKENMTALEGLYQSRCGKPMSANPACNMNPPLAAACINARCTLDYAYKHNADAQDYKPGAYPVPETAVPSKVPAQAYQGVDDTKGGFSAYNLPNAEVKQNTVGTITTKVYVPPSAPVTGGNYVPVDGTTPAAPVAPAVPATSAPIAAAPAPAPVAPAPAQKSAPAAIPPAAVPTPASNATPAVPAMTPSRPNQLPPVAPPAPAPATATPTYVPPPAPAAAPAYVPAETKPSGPAIPAVGASGVPQAPPGSTPIPPSDLKPTPTFVPPAGTAVPANPEDPGAPPPEGTQIMMKGQPGSEDMMPLPQVRGDAPKQTFGTAPDAPAKNVKFGVNE